MIGWNLALPPEPPLGAVAGDFTHYRVGTGLAADGGQIGYDVSWVDANGGEVGRSVCGLVGATVIDQAEYETLLATWRTIA